MAELPETLTREEARAYLDQELAEARRKLSEGYRMIAIGRLVAGVVHEINNPIGSIVSNNEVTLRALETLKQKLDAAIASGEPPPAKAVELVNTIASLAAVDKIACERISAVVRSLKTFSRTEDQELRKSDLNALLRDTLKLVDCQYKRRIKLESSFGELPEVECYPQLMSQVFLNIMVNAAQAIDGEGTITLTTRAVGDEVEITVSDTGRGVDPEHSERIFKAGFTTKPVGVGTGLGLALCKEIVEETHGGRIWFESELGRGTTFYVRVPVKAPRKES
jgi:signal transduction histidine kinase